MYWKVPWDANSHIDAIEVENAHVWVNTSITLAYKLASAKVGAKIRWGCLFGNSWMRLLFIKEDILKLQGEQMFEIAGVRRTVYLGLVWKQN